MRAMLFALEALNAAPQSDEERHELIELKS
jgi:hypothetical protein